MHENLRSIDLNLLTALEALLEEAHVSRAAERLNLSQSAMSRTLARLRDLLDDPLLIRGPKGMILTARAQQLHVPLKQVLGGVKGLLQREVFDPLTTDRHFHIKGTSYVAQAYFPAALQRFYQEAPGASLSIHNLTFNEMAGDEAASSDLVLCGGGMGIPDSFKQRQVGHDRMVVVMSADHPLAGVDLTLDSYVAYPHSLITVGGSPHSGTMEPVLERLGHRRDIQLRLPHIVAGLEMVGQSHLLLTMASNLVEKFKTPFNLVIKPLPFDYPPIDYYFSWHPVHHQDPGHIWLRNLFYEEVRKVIGGG
ncbi:LysR family transcriptional regulator [Paremcibacter congregatus]|uniref:LysR family transcriptional regulator n=1 Tax=Paremcibacter congregatus TaxID=2043170 RepID=A0A2G4YVQ3_9PROT|nr:LysR family transcriptional regulator [Paremcibacter congregatus]PHZ86411.1 LysR family transcriptional regulator [Paremcibacter congregatus]QDE28494.1 LysR family transcriptional regulator [Paremcibacter congregatus]|tara:strand:- start:6850 stop:7773 length:924 start_codon:yes stop_codon:yes gene_type:complete